VLVRRHPPDRCCNYGDRVRITGRLETPGDDNDISPTGITWRAKGSTPLMRYYPGISGRESSQGSPLLGVIYSLRERAYAALTRSIPQPEASLLAGILLGIETDMPYDDLDRISKQAPAISSPYPDSISPFKPPCSAPSSCASRRGCWRRSWRSSPSRPIPCWSGRRHRWCGRRSWARLGWSGRPSGGGRRAPIRWSSPQR
jgi:hypothetical protein